MKKLNKRLVLSRETLGTLNLPEGKIVAGVRIKTIGVGSCNECTVGNTCFTCPGATCLTCPGDTCGPTCPF